MTQFQQMKDLSSQERLCFIIEFLSKSFPKALKTKELANILRTKEANISRDISVLEKFDFISKNDNGIRLSMKFAKLSMSMKQGYDNAIAKLQREKEEYFSVQEEDEL